MTRWVQAGFLLLCSAAVIAVWIGRLPDCSLIEERDFSRIAVAHSLMSPSNNVTVTRSQEADLPQEFQSFPGGVSSEEMEAREALKGLLRENENFRKEVLDLKEQIRRLTHFLAEEKLENDRMRLRTYAMESGGLPVSSEAKDLPSSGRVLDVNPELEVIVLDQGSESGVRHGMEFAVVRQERWIGRIRAVDVRERISGAEVIEIFSKDVMVSRGDRVVPWIDR